MPKILAIIPARGGSKGIPGKNVVPLGGRPLLTYTIAHARLTPAISRIVVSTDDKDIANVATTWGAEVIWRPDSISGDDASSEAALLHVLDVLQEKEAYQPDLVVFLQATSPLRQQDDIEKAIARLQQEGADSLFSSHRVEGFLWRQQGDILTPLNYDPAKRQRRQMLEATTVEENGSIYIFKPWVLRQNQSRLGGKIVAYQMSPLDSFQVDLPTDLDQLEQILTVRPQKLPLPDLAQIQLLVLDFDGVMTDNRVWVNQDGTEAVVCHRGDGWGIARLKETGLRIIVLSTEKNPVVAARCQKLKLPYIHGSDDKLSHLQEIAHQHSLEPEQIAYVGNDVNDKACLAWVGMPIAVADATPDILKIARLVTKERGGHGAVREVCDLILAQKKLSYVA